MSDIAPAGSENMLRVLDFRDGIDVRRSALSAPVNSLRSLVNGVVNQGGEIEKALIFLPVITGIPADVFGVMGQAGMVHFWTMNPGAQVPVSAGPHPSVVHILENTGQTGARLLHVECYDNKFYVILQMTDGTTAHFYDGVRLSQTQAPGGYRTGNFCKLSETKIYWTDGPLLRFSDVDSPGTDANSTATPGGGFIDLSKQDSDGENVIAMESYYNYTAVFARLLTQIWSLDADPTNNSLTQLLRIGTLAPNSVFQFGTSDVLFLSDSGVRSLRAVNMVTMSAAYVDVGSPIDDLVATAIRQDPNGGAYACSTIQPTTGRYWCAINGQVFVLSYFPSAEINAWSTFSPGFNIDYLSRADDRVYAFSRETNALYLYGGLDNATYDPDILVDVVTPMYSSDMPEQWKGVSHIEVLAENTWSMFGGMDPGNPQNLERIATFTNQTFSQQNIAFDAYGTHLGLRFQHQGPGAAKLSGFHVKLRFGAN